MPFEEVEKGAEDWDEDGDFIARVIDCGLIPSSGSKWVEVAVSELLTGSVDTLRWYCSGLQEKERDSDNHRIFRFRGAEDPVDESVQRFCGLVRQDVQCAKREPTAEEVDEFRDNALIAVMPMELGESEEQAEAEKRVNKWLAERASNRQRYLQMKLEGGTNKMSINSKSCGGDGSETKVPYQQE